MKNFEAKRSGNEPKVVSIMSLEQTLNESKTMKHCIILARAYKQTMSRVLGHVGTRRINLPSVRAGYSNFYKQQIITRPSPWNEASQCRGQNLITSFTVDQSVEWMLSRANLRTNQWKEFGHVRFLEQS